MAFKNTSLISFMSCDCQVYVLWSWIFMLWMWKKKNSRYGFLLLFINFLTISFIPFNKISNSQILRDTSLFPFSYNCNCYRDTSIFIFSSICVFMLSIYAGLVIDIPVVRLKWQLLKEKKSWIVHRLCHISQIYRYITFLRFLD